MTTFKSSYNFNHDKLAKQRFIIMKRVQPDMGKTVFNQAQLAVLNFLY